MGPTLPLTWRWISQRFPTDPQTHAENTNMMRTRLIKKEKLKWPAKGEKIKYVCNSAQSLHLPRQILVLFSDPAGTGLCPLSSRSSQVSCSHLAAIGLPKGKGGTRASPMPRSMPYYQLRFSVDTGSIAQGSRVWESGVWNHLQQELWTGLQFALRHKDL